MDNDKNTDEILGEMSELARAKELLNADEIYQALRLQQNLKDDIHTLRAQERRQANKDRLKRLKDSGDTEAYQIEQQLQNEENEPFDIFAVRHQSSQLCHENRWLKQTAQELTSENVLLSSKLTASYFERAKLEDQIFKLSAKLEVKILKAEFKEFSFPQGPHNATTISQYLKSLGFPVGKRKVLEWLKEWPGSKDAWHDSELDRKPQYRFLDDRNGRKNLREFSQWCAERKLRAK